MSTVIRLLVVATLGAAAWKAYAVRERLGSGETDPAARQSLRKALAAIPLDLPEAGYRGTPVELSEEVVASSGADRCAAVDYTGRDGREVRLYVAGSVGNEENFHAPSDCMPSQGWEILEQTTVPFDAYPVATESPRMRRLLLQYGSQRMLVYYWFQAGDRVADHEYWIRWVRFLDLFRNVPFRPALIVCLYAPVVRDVEATERAAGEFLNAVAPRLQHALAAGD